MSITTVEAGQKNIQPSGSKNIFITVTVIAVVIIGAVVAVLVTVSISDDKPNVVPSKNTPTGLKVVVVENLDDFKNNIGQIFEADGKISFKNPAADPENKKAKSFEAIFSYKKDGLNETVFKELIKANKLCCPWKH